MSFSVASYFTCSPRASSASAISASSPTEGAPLCCHTASPLSTPLHRKTNRKLRPFLQPTRCGAVLSAADRWPSSNDSQRHNSNSVLPRTPGHGYITRRLTANAPECPQVRNPRVALSAGGLIAMGSTSKLRFRTWASVTGVLGIILLSLSTMVSAHEGATGDPSYYHGTIGRTLEVLMTIRRHGNELSGSYEYASQRKPIELRGRVLPSGEYEIAELDPRGKATAKFAFNNPLGRMEGTWQSGQKNQSVVLGEVTSAEVEQLHRMWSGSRKVKDIVVAPFYACAVEDAGVFCWGTVSGSRSLSAAGPGRIAYRALPHLIIPTDITALALGYPISCYIRHGGMYCWRRLNPTLDLVTPTVIPGFQKDVTAVGMSGDYACAIVASALKCWPGKVLDQKTVITVIDSGVIRLSSGMPNCVLTAANVLCWTFNENANKQEIALRIHEVEGVSEKVQALSSFDDVGMGTRYGCAVDSGSLKCWGDDIGNVLLGRRGKTAFRNLPPGAIPSMEAGVTDVSVENENVCAIREGKVLCWGSNWYGQSGDGTTSLTTGPAEVSLPAPALRVAVAGTYVCALTADNHVWCWGDNEFGQTGNISRDTCELPNGKMPDAILTPCNKRPVQARGIP